MAIDDLLRFNLDALGGYIKGSMNRWGAAAMKVRAKTYTRDEFWIDLRDQTVANWDIWSDSMNFAGFPVLPTIAIRGRYNGLSGSDGSAYVNQRLTGAAFKATDFESFAGGASMKTSAVGAVTVSKEGDFDGKVKVVLNINAPAAGQYRGLIMVLRSHAAGYEPLAWVVVEAE
jgi:hypothetical protein